MVEYQEIARVVIRSSLSNPQIQQTEISERLTGILQSDTRILGAGLLDLQGNLINSVGIKIGFRPEATHFSQTEYSSQTHRYELFFSATDIGNGYSVLLSMNASRISQDLDAFLIRILGLVLLICMVAGAVVCQLQCWNAICHPICSVRANRLELPAPDFGNTHITNH